MITNLQARPTAVLLRPNVRPAPFRSAPLPGLAPRDSRARPAGVQTIPSPTPAKSGQIPVSPDWCASRRCHQPPHCSSPPPPRSHWGGTRTAWTSPPPPLRPHQDGTCTAWTRPPPRPYQDGICTPGPVHRTGSTPPLRPRWWAAGSTTASPRKVKSGGRGWGLQLDLQPGLQLSRNDRRPAWQ